MRPKNTNSVSNLISSELPSSLVGSTESLKANPNGMKLLGGASVGTVVGGASVAVLGGVTVVTGDADVSISRSRIWKEVRIIVQSTESIFSAIVQTTSGSPST